jgi:hypothetical protein
MPEKCGRGHLMAGANVRRATAINSAACLLCEKERHQERGRHARPSHQRARAPIDPGLVASLRKAVGARTVAPVVYKRPVEAQVSRRHHD